MTRTALILAIALVVSACATERVPQVENLGPMTLPAPTATTTTVALTTTTVEVVESVEAFPELGIPGDALEICGVVQRPGKLQVVVSDADTGDTWANTSGAVSTLDTGQWCWEGEFPAEMETGAGDRYQIEPGVYGIDVYYEGEAILHGTFEVSSAALVAATPPSQSAEDALRDGVIPEIAELSFHRRVRTELEATTEEGIWTLTRLSRAVEQESYETGCGLGDPLGVYPIDIVCADQYGELLLVNAGEIVKAYPMPGAPPSWIHVTEDSIYSGHLGDGGLPDSTLVRVDRDTLAATVVVIPLPRDASSEWLPTWHIAPVSYTDVYYDAVHINTDGPGTAVSSWVGEFTVDLKAIDEIIETFSTATSEWAPGTVTCAAIEGNFPAGVDDHGVYLDRGLVSYYRENGLDTVEEVFIQFVDDPTCTADSETWAFMIGYLLDPDSLHRSDLCDLYARLQRSDPPPANLNTVLHHLAAADQLCE